jgi:cellulose biosynthesis protein BcsQ
MAGARYVVLGLAPARSPWFREVAQWANAGSVPAEFVKCLSAEEVRARLAGGRPFSALLVDAGLPSLDRDLIDVADAVGCAVVVVGGPRGGRDWSALGAAAVLPAHFDRKDLLDALGAHAGMIGRVDHTADQGDGGEPGGWQAPMIAVTGPGGTGASTVAIALAQGLAGDVRAGGSVLLADLCLCAEQSMLHDARDVVPGVQELVDAFRSGRPGPEEITALTFAVPERGYRLLLGIRRARAWSTIRPRAFQAALEGMRRTHRLVVADVDPDLEGEEEGGSVEVEERHVMARTVVARADAVFIVGQPGMKGLHALTRVIADVLDYGVPGARVVPVVNRGPRHARARAEITGAVSDLLPAWAGAGMGSPVFLPERRIDEALRDGIRLPEPMAAPLVGAYRAVTRMAEAEERRPSEPLLVTPGTVGSWSTG